MHIKEFPEDFMVEELAEHEIVSGGKYSLLRLWKRNYTTERAIQRLADFLRIPRKRFGYAGTKDSRAVTTQYVTVRGEVDISGFKDKDIKVDLLGKVKEQLSLGRLDGNRFTIVVRGLANEEVHELEMIPNYFDEQRFSVANADIGRHIIKSEFNEAVELVKKTSVKLVEEIDRRLGEKLNDFVGALLLVPRHILLMYVHAYQSLLWNAVLTKFILKENSGAKILDGPVQIAAPTVPMDQVTIPIVGFGSELEEPFSIWYEDLLRQEGITQRDFVIRQIPFLTMEGDSRDAFFPVKDLEVSERVGDTQKLSFTLQKGSYATIVVKCLYRAGTVI